MLTETKPTVKASELRIGNWVKWSNTFHKVHDILSPDMNFINGCIVTNYFDAGRGLEEFEPIPLTPELLEKCGFEKEGLTSMSINGFPLYFKITENGLRCWGFHYVGKLIPIPCKYLHQLQNLYFSLTGEELPINL